jgi:alkylhydroperoxidase family enzyme
MTPRIPPADDAELDDRQRELLAGAGFGDGPPLNIFRTLVRHPRLFKRWLPFGGVLLTGSVPARERELLILRTGHNCGSDYEWHQHVRIGLEAGLTEAEIERVQAGPDAEGWDGFDAALLRAADELHRDSRIGEGTWQALAARYDDKQLVEVCMVVGQYHLVAFTLNSLGVEIER